MNASAPKKTNTILDKFEVPPAARFLGFEFLDVDSEAMTMQAGVRASEAMLNPRGTVQGGFLTAMLDEVMGVLALIVTRKGPASVDLHTQFFRPALPGKIIGHSKINHLAGSTIFTQGSLFDAEGNKLASATQTQRLFDIPGVSDA